MDKNKIKYGLLGGLIGIMTVLLVGGIIYFIIPKTSTKTNDINPTEDDICKLTYNKMENGTTELEKQYGYSVTLNGKCNEYIVVDKKGDKKFAIYAKEIEQKKDNEYKKYVKVTTALGEYINDNYHKDYLNTFEKEDNIEIIFYMPDEDTFIFDGTSSTVALPYNCSENCLFRKLYIYYPQILSKNGTIPNVEIKYNDYDPDLVYGISNLEIDADNNKFYVYETIIFTDGNTSNKFKVAAKIKTMTEEFDIDALLAEYGLDNFDYERKISYTKTYDTYTTAGWDVTKTIKDYYNEKVEELRNTN